MHSYGQNKECFADQLLCEYLVNPIGIDAIHPRFKWKINDQRQGALQQAYKITVGIDSSSVAKGFGSVWNPEKEESSTLLTPYQGKELLPFTK